MVDGDAFLSIDFSAAPSGDGDFAGAEEEAEDEAANGDCRTTSVGSDAADFASVATPARQTTRAPLGAPRRPWPMRARLPLTRLVRALSGRRDDDATVDRGRASNGSQARDVGGDSVADGSGSTMDGDDGASSVPTPARALHFDDHSVNTDATAAAAATATRVAAAGRPNADDAMARRSVARVGRGRSTGAGNASSAPRSPRLLQLRLPPGVAAALARPAPTFNFQAVAEAAVAPPLAATPAAGAAQLRLAPLDSAVAPATPVPARAAAPAAATATSTFNPSAPLCPRGAAAEILAVFESRVRALLCPTPSRARASAATGSSCSSSSSGGGAAPPAWETLADEGDGRAPSSSSPPAAADGSAAAAAAAAAGSGDAINGSALPSSSAPASVAAATQTLRSDALADLNRVVEASTFVGPASSEAAAVEDRLSALAAVVLSPVVTVRRSARPTPRHETPRQLQPASASTPRVRRVAAAVGGASTPVALPAGTATTADRTPINTTRVWTERRSPSGADAAVASAAVSVQVPAQLLLPPATDADAPRADVAVTAPPVVVAAAGFGSPALVGSNGRPLDAELLTRPVSPPPPTHRFSAGLGAAAMLKPWASPASSAASAQLHASSTPALPETEPASVYAYTPSTKAAAARGGAASGEPKAAALRSPAPLPLSYSALLLTTSAAKRTPKRVRFTELAGARTISAQSPADVLARALHLQQQQQRQPLEDAGSGAAPAARAAVDAAARPQPPKRPVAPREPSGGARLARRLFDDELGFADTVPSPSFTAAAASTPRRGAGQLQLQLQSGRVPQPQPSPPVHDFGYSRRLQPALPRAVEVAAAKWAIDAALGDPTPVPRPFAPAPLRTAAVA